MIDFKVVQLNFNVIWLLQSGFIIVIADKISWILQLQQQKISGTGPVVHAVYQFGTGYSVCCKDDILSQLY